MVDSDETCKCHSGVKQKISDHDKGLEHCDGHFKELWAEVKGKTPIKFFMILVSVVILAFGFQWATYERLSGKIEVLSDRIATIDKNVAVISDRVR